MVRACSSQTAIRSPTRGQIVRSSHARSPSSANARSRHRRAIDPAVRRHLRPPARDHRIAQPRARIQLVHDSVGRLHRRPQPLQCFQSGRLTRPHAPGQPDQGDRRLHPHGAFAQLASVLRSLGIGRRLGLRSAAPSRQPPRASDGCVRPPRRSGSGAVSASGGAAVTSASGASGVTSASVTSSASGVTSASVTSGASGVTSAAGASASGDSSVASAALLCPRLRRSASASVDCVVVRASPRLDVRVGLTRTRHRQDLVLDALG